MYLQATRLAFPGVGDPPVATQAAPNGGRLAPSRLECNAAQLKAISEILGRAITPEEVAETVRQAMAGAIALARAGAAPVAGRQARLFEAVFGLPPSWQPAGAAWRLGGVIRKRFAMTAQLLASGSLRISCFGWSWPPSGDDTPEKYFIRAIGDKYRIGLGKRFWEGVRDEGVQSVEMTLVAGALRVAFGWLIKYTKDAKTKNRAYCYMRYALHSAGRQVPLWLGDACPIPPDRWHRLMPSAAPTPAPAPAPSAPPAPPTPTMPPRLRLTDEELERILGRKPVDPLAAHIDWIISQVPPTGIARPTLGDLLKRKLDDAVDQASERLGVPQRFRKYVRQVAQGAVKTGSKLVIEEGLRQIGVGSKEAIEAVWGAVERAAKESP